MISEHDMENMKDIPLRPLQLRDDEGGLPAAKHLPLAVLPCCGSVETTSSEVQHMMWPGTVTHFLETFHCSFPAGRNWMDAEAGKAEELRLGDEDWQRRFDDEAGNRIEIYKTESCRSEMQASTLNLHARTGD